MKRAQCLSFLLLFWSLPLSAQQLRIYHIDVEQASATLFVAPGGKTLLVDSGKNGMGGRIKTVMDRAGVSAIDFFVDTHYHEDHYGGIDDLVDLGVPVRDAYDRGDKNLLPADKLSEVTFQDYQAAVGNRAHQLTRGMTLQLDPLMTVTCISSSGLVIGENPTGVNNDENNLSISLLITLGTFRYFIGGDIQSPTEQKIADRDLVKDVDVYIADHHGSDTSSILPFIQDLSPHVIIVSNGDNAGFHHPRQVVLTSYTQLPGPPTVFQTNKCTKGPPCGNVADEFIGDPQTTDQDGTIALIADVATHSYAVAFDSGGSRTFQFRTFKDPIPTLSSLNPASGGQGTIVNVTFTGTGFIPGLTLNAGTGINVSNIQVSSATAASATFSIVSAAVGVRDVTVTTSGGTSNVVNFTVTASIPSPPLLTSITPASASQGATVPVTLIGTGFAAGLTVITGSGLAVSNINVTNATSATANFTIASTASLGVRSITVTTSGGTSNGIDFTVAPASPAPPTLLSVSPAAGMPGATVPVTLIGAGFLAGMEVNPGNGIEVSSINVTSATSATAIFSIASTAGLGVRSITLTVSGGISNAVTFSVNPQKITHDFNFDGKADVLWRDAAGNVSMWLMNGFNASNSFIANIWIGWTIVGSGDFGGDGREDILWRDTDGNMAIWMMDGTTVSGYSSIGNVPTSSTVAAVADFNGDGKSDVLWRDSVGNVSIWLMNGYNITTNSFIGNVWLGWTIVGSGDFDSDGKSDILWRDTGGNVAIWLMDGTTVVSYGSVRNSPGTSTLAAVADFNADGKADILWQDTSGGVTLWTINGYAVTTNTLIAIIGNGWTIIGNGDFDGDGKSDILWKDTAGNAAIWLMDGPNVSSWSSMGNVSDRTSQ